MNIECYNIDTVPEVKWDNFIDYSSNGTIFQKIAFLKYHKGKFHGDEEFIMIYKNNKIICVVSYLIKHENQVEIITPYGASWGGIVCINGMGLQMYCDLIDNLIVYFANLSASKIRICNTPHHYTVNEDRYLDYALCSRGFVCIKRDVMHVLTLNKSLSALSHFDSRTRSKLRKVLSDVDIIENVKAEQFYDILMENQNHLKSKPTHSFEELNYLMDSFQEITIDIAISKCDQSKAGVCYFESNRHSVTAFYIAQENNARGKDMLLPIFERGIERYLVKNYKYFDFGTSTLNGIIQNPGVSQFKESFGAVCRLRETYELSLTY
jgi:hypothetical protein